MNIGAYWIGDSYFRLILITASNSAWWM